MSLVRAFIISTFLVSPAIAADVCVKGVVIPCPPPPPPPLVGTKALKVNDFLDSIGTQIKNGQGQSVPQAGPMVDYMGMRVLRVSYTPASVPALIDLHYATGVKFVVNIGSGASETRIPNVLATARALESVGALLAIEGQNEINNFGGCTYQGVHSTSTATSLPCAKIQRDLYNAVKADPQLAPYPVFNVSSAGAQIDDQGLQFLTLPAGYPLPAGTKFGEYQNMHNYMYPNNAVARDNMPWLAASTAHQTNFDGMHGNLVTTWYKKFPGVAADQVAAVPKVTTETGIWDIVSEPIQGGLVLDMYLDQFKMGYKYTMYYESLDFGGARTGLYTNATAPKLAATWMHNMTTILRDTAATFSPGAVPYSISAMPVTTHDLLMQKSDNKFVLAVWSERLTGQDTVTVNLGSIRSGVKVFDPTVGTSPVSQPGDVSSVTLTVDSHPFLIEFE